MAGLNIAHEAIELGTGNSDLSRTTGTRLKKLNARIEQALADYRQPEIN